MADYRGYLLVALEVLSMACVLIFIGIWQR